MASWGSWPLWPPKFAYARRREMKEGITKERGKERTKEREERSDVRQLKFFGLKSAFWKQLGAVAVQHGFTVR